MSDALPPLRADGERVWVASATEGDIPAYELAVEMSRERLGVWNPVDPHALPLHLRAQSRAHRTLLIHAREPVGGHDLVGKVNVSNMIRGRLLSGGMGYDAFDPYAGQGLFGEGLRLVIDLALSPEPRGMGLHRLEANVQPGNTRSAAVLRRLGLVCEGFSPGFLYLPDASGAERWRDHDRYAVLASEWPAQPFRRRHPRRVLVLVNGVPGAGKTTLARALAAELGVPMLSKDVVKERVADLAPDGARGWSGALGAGAMEALWGLLADSPLGAVVESVFLSGRDDEHVRAGVQDAGFEAGRVLEVWCDVPVKVARARADARVVTGERHGVHGDVVGDERWGQWAEARPLSLGPVVSVDTTAPTTPRTLVDLALRAGATAR